MESCLSRRLRGQFGSKTNCVVHLTSWPGNKNNRHEIDYLTRKNPGLSVPSLLPFSLSFSGCLVTRCPLHHHLKFSDIFVVNRGEKRGQHAWTFSNSYLSGTSTTLRSESNRCRANSAVRGARSSASLAG